MKRQDQLTHEFVEFIPDQLQQGTVYISIPYATVVHKCCCGCGREVVTPLSPTTGWKLIFDGETISLDPSIGNWNLPCQSHYWIRQNRVLWVPKRSKREINSGKTQDNMVMDKYYNGESSPVPQTIITKTEGTNINKPLENLWQRIKKKF
jgi:hypothetical protein